METYLSWFSWITPDTPATDDEVDDIMDDILPSSMFGIMDISWTFWKTPKSLPSRLLPVAVVLLVIAMCMIRFVGVMVRTFVKKPSTVDAKLPYIDDRDQKRCYDHLKGLVMKALECPVCYEVKTGPIFQCRNGHNVCEACRPYINGDRCVLCNADMTSSRNWLAEDLSSNFVGVPCRNVLEGCKEIVLGVMTEMHLSVCSFSYSCMVHMVIPSGEPHTDSEYVRCLWRGCYDDLMDHVRAEHPDHAHYDVASVSVPDVDLNHPLCVCNHYCLLESDEQLFWCRFAVYYGDLNPRENVNVFAYVQLVASRSRPNLFPGSEFKFEIKLLPATKLVVSFVGKPRPLGTDLELDEDCVQLASSLLEAFVTSEKQLYCQITLVRYITRMPKKF